MSSTAPRRARMVALDLDGTLLTSAKDPCANAMRHLEALEGTGTLRVIATGRNVQAAAKVIAPGSPVDYVVAGSGGIVIDWGTQEVVACRTLTGAAKSIATALVRAGVPFLLLKAPPRNHECLIHIPDGLDAAVAADPSHPHALAMAELHRRLDGDDHEGGQHAFSFEELDAVEAREGGFGQFLLMGIADLDATKALIGAAAPEGSIRFVQLSADSGAVWLEVLPAEVSKASGLAAVAGRHGIAREDVVAMGNDWNDLDMLEWAGRGVAMGNTPTPFKEHLRASLPHVVISERTNDDGGVHEGLCAVVPVVPSARVADDAL